VSELLPRPVRLLIGATSAGVADRRLRDAASGKIVLVTGASSGVGKATALRLARAGATVLLVARRTELLEELRSEIDDCGGVAYVHPCDLSDVDQAAQLASTVLAEHGHVDVVVSNAGVSIRRWVSESYERFRDIERTIRVNYLGPVRLLLGLLPSMRERGSGQIVNVSTIGVDFPALRWSAYIASKAAFEAWLSGAAPELLADGVSTTSIHMQLVRSPMLGPFRMWNYLPGMSTDEAAGIVARAIVDRPRTISPLWARIGAAGYKVAQGPIDTVLSWQARALNPASRGGLVPSVDPILHALADGLGGVAAIASARVVQPTRPDRLARAVLASHRFGFTPGAALAAAAELYGSRPGVIDELGTVTFAELDTDAKALAGALHAVFGLEHGHRVAIMCRNHRGFVHGAVAASRLGCDLVPLNTDFAGPQLADVLAREQVSVVIYDQEFDPRFGDSGFDGVRILAWHEEPTDRPTIDQLIALNAGDAPAPTAPGRTVMLTSGTTGTPKGAVRTISPFALAPLGLAALLDVGRVRPAPRSGDPFVVGPPLFHLFGMIALVVSSVFGSPIVIRRRFDPEATLAQIERTRAGVLLAVPTMLGRIVDLPADVRDRYDTASLKMVVSGAAPLAPELAQAVMDLFGNVLYNGYASTEVGIGALATPHDLRTAPGTVGRPAAGVTVKILDEHGRERPSGETGRIFIGSPMLFEGYTGGGAGKEVIGGLMSTGDVGHFDDRGRLFIDGRDDDMIVSGGENVFPQEVEELLSAHEAVADAAVFGVPDEDFGQRLAASVVRKPDAPVSAEELQAFVRQRLARYKVPREIEFVDELPRTSTGKLQRRRLGDPDTATS
jgi:acyl-CoA synthetase (AMP-forming)/AMP-acid ligase II/NAD(P)-dependent dehydrogenase (short-subunit alcohol dehydrogenase family)